MIAVNGFLLGRYYNSAGPQKTLYLPGPLMRSIPFLSPSEHTPNARRTAAIIQPVIVPVDVIRLEKNPLTSSEDAPLSLPVAIT